MLSPFLYASTATTIKSSGRRQFIPAITFFVIGAIFLLHLKQFEGCPSQIQTDCGSGNVVLAAIQSHLKRNHPNEYAGLKSHTDSYITWETKT